MAYKITLVSKVFTLGESTLQAKIIFDVDSAGSDVVINMSDKLIKIIEWGENEMSYSLDNVNADGDAFMVPNSFSFRLSDGIDYLVELLYGYTALAAATDKRPQIEIYLNGVLDFAGKVREKGSRVKESSKNITITADSNTEKINQRLLFDSEGNAYNPFGYATDDFIPIVEILEKIYQLAEPTISFSGNTLDVIHDWSFLGVLDGFYPYYVNNISFVELYQYAYPLFFDASKGLKNCGDILRKLAIDWCAFTGFQPGKKAFFKKLFSYDASNLQDIGKVDDHEYGYNYNVIDYVLARVIDPSSVVDYERGTDSGLEGKTIKRDVIPGFWIGKTYPASTEISNVKALSLSRPEWFGCYGAEGETLNAGDIYSCNGSQFEFKIRHDFEDGFGNHSALSFERISGVNDLPASGTLTLVTGSGFSPISFTNGMNLSGDYKIYQAADPSLFSGAFKDNGDLIAEFWYRNRAFVDKCRTDIFMCRKLNIDFIKDFTKYGLKYQPIKLRKIYSKHVTQLEALCLGEV